MREPKLVDAVTAVAGPPAPADACATRISGMPLAHYDPAREVFELAALGADLAIGDATESRRAIARMAHDGTIAWTHELSTTRGMPPALAVGDDVGVVWAEGDALELATFARDGTPRIAAHRIAKASGRACIAPLADGWAVVAADIAGSAYVRVARDGTASAAVAAPAAMECGLAPAGAGVILAMSRPGPHSDTNYLYTVVLAADGTPVGGAKAENKIEERFARSPVIARFAKGYVLAWADPLEVDDAEAFRAVRLDAKGAALGAPVPFGWTRGTGGWGVVADRDPPVLVRATRTDWIEQPLCWDRPIPSPPRMRPPSRSE